MHYHAATDEVMLGKMYVMCWVPLFVYSSVVAATVFFLFVCFVIIMLDIPTSIGLHWKSSYWLVCVLFKNSVLYD